MPIPLALAVPAAAGAAAYINAKASVGYDLKLSKCIFTSMGRTAYGKYHDRLNLFYELEYLAQRPETANQNLLIFQDRSWTYAQMHDAVLRYAHWMSKELEIKPGNLVAMYFENSDTFIVLWLALWSIGAKPVFINCNLIGKSLKHCLTVSGTKLCFVDPTLAPHIAELEGELADVRSIIITPGVQSAALSWTPFRAPDSARSGQEVYDIALIIYTSGTTGLPKPAIVSWLKVWVGGIMSGMVLDRGNGDIMYSAMPLYHSMSSVFGFCATLLAGSTYALGRKFSTKTFWRDIRDSKATSILYIGEALRYLLATPPEYDPITGECLDQKHLVKKIYGAGLRPDVWQSFKKRFGIETVGEFYGATEGTIGLWNISNNESSEGAVGRHGWLLGLYLQATAQIVVVDWENEKPWRDPKTGLCAKVKPGEPGEMLCKVPAENTGERFQGYLNNEKANNDKVLRDVFTKGDAWFRTGDVLRWTKDGQIFFCDRLGDTFRWKGENVSTLEVGHIMGMHPQVHEANVYGVELPNHDGRAGCATVTFDTGRPSNEVLQSLAKHVSASLPRYAIPLFIRVSKNLGSLEHMTGTFKQQKVALRSAGVDPNAPEAADIQTYWLKGDSYVPFGQKEWGELQGGRLKL